MVCQSPIPRFGLSRHFSTGRMYSGTCGPVLLQRPCSAMNEVGCPAFVASVGPGGAQAVRGEVGCAFQARGGGETLYSLVDGRAGHARTPDSRGGVLSLSVADWLWRHC